MKRAGLLVALFCAASASADFRSLDFDVFLGGGKSSVSPHGRATFRDIEFSVLGHSNWIAHWIPRTDAGVSVAYSDIRQPKSWFGHFYGDGDDKVRGEWAYFFLHRAWREGQARSPFVELGTGPMWSNRRVPAATSRFNFHSQLGLGARVTGGDHPLYVVYRFSHISNLVFGPHNPGHSKRNPGWNVNTLLIGTRLRSFRR